MKQKIALLRTNTGRLFISTKKEWRKTKSDIEENGDVVAHVTLVNSGTIIYQGNLSWIDYSGEETYVYDQYDGENPA